MLYIEDFKNAYRNGLAIAKCEDEIEELEIKKSNAKSESAKKRIDTKIDMLKYQIGMSYGNQTNVDEFIKKISDPFTKQIFYHRYLKGESWAAVAASCSKGYVSNDTVRKIATRYLKSMGVTKRPAEV